MHIKSITLSNFRSFKQQPEIHPFSSEMNVVVGRNGSGKSNLFDAVQFVLACPKFYSLRAEERQSLLHEGSGSAAVNAFVEIVFDNTDHRFALENSDEVVVRRTIGLKKDEFFLQRKRATKQEITSLLEGAGFSKSNPYFIVQQGKVNALCTMSDMERLQLLKEVAGTTVYDEKKEESLLKMEENKHSIDKINETLSYMEQKLNELQDEKEELDAYQILDKERRAVEYTLYDLELRRARESLDEIEHARNEEVDKLRTLHEEVKNMHEQITSIQSEELTKRNAWKRNATYIQGLEKEKIHAVTQRTKLSLECREWEEQFVSENELYKKNQMELSKLTKEIHTMEQELVQKVQPAYEKAKLEMWQLSNEREVTVKRMEGLYAKQGRGKQFRTRKERDAHLQSQIKELNAEKSTKEDCLHEMQSKVSSLRKLLATQEKEMASQSREIHDKNILLEELTKSIDEKKRLRNEMADSRKEQWRTTHELSGKVQDAKEACRKALYDMRQTMPRATSSGLDALKHIVASEGLTVGVQYFGLVMDNFELNDDKYMTAVEVAAQNSLFHIIVDNDATAARLMKRLEEDKMGRVTFLPLNQLHIDAAVRYPESTDVAPLMEQCITFQPAVRRAMEHVFARKLLARSVDVASTWSMRSNMDAITLDGDLCSRKGALSGGFVDLDKSRLRAHYMLKQMEEQLRKLENVYQQKKEESAAMDLQVSNVMGEVQRLEAKHANLDHMMGRIEDDVRKLANARERQEKQVKLIIEEDIPPLESQIASLATQVECLENEMGTELTTKFSQEEQSQLDDLKATQTRLDDEIEKCHAVLEEATIQRQKLTSLLEDNLIVRKNELIESPTRSNRSSDTSGGVNASISQAQMKAELENKRRKLEEATQTADEVERQLAEVKKMDEKLRTEIRELKNQFDQLKTEDAALQKELEECHDSQEKLLNKRSMCIQKREDYMCKIQNIGSLPPAAELSSYAKKSIPSLMKNLEDINKKLRKYSHVNKKAFDQFVNFAEQRSQLIQRRKEIDEGGVKVKELIESLDRKKDEAINRTFRGVSAHFRDVFKELVPNGAGELIMRTAMDEGVGNVTDSETEEEQEEEQEGLEIASKKMKTATDVNNPDVSLFRGVGIKVRFSRSSENFLMSQLSGGQKALVAMALIFAIQRCDPAPFYLFDELDQALDSTYRAAVASLIKRQATPSEDAENPREGTQFICSTFRPELVAAANRCFGISHQNKVSSLHLLSKNDSLHFIANLMSEEEVVGEVTSLATSKAVGSTTAREVEA